MLYYEGRSLNGLRSPSGIEALIDRTLDTHLSSLNGLRSPSGIEFVEPGFRDPSSVLD